MIDRAEEVLRPSDFLQTDKLLNVFFVHGFGEQGDNDQYNKIQNQTLNACMDVSYLWKDFEINSISIENTHKDAADCHRLGCPRPEESCDSQRQQLNDGPISSEQKRNQCLTTEDCHQV